MRKRIAALLAVCALAVCPLSACDVDEMTTLAEVSRPYVGEYRCERLLLGGEDMLPRFEICRLELAYGGEFTLFYRTREGLEGEYGGYYSFSPDQSSVVFSARGMEREFPVVSGSIVIELNLGGRLLLAVFKM